jgi:ATP/maltotriose-dependent transcriptional regulator MalT
MHTHCGEHWQAIQCYERSLQDLPEKDWIWRVTTFHGLGHIHMHLGKLRQARQYCRQAEEAHHTREGQNWYKLLSLKGEVALAEGDSQTARRTLHIVRDAFSQGDNPFELALVSISLAKACLLAGDHAAVQTIAAEMMQLLRPLQRHKLASGAIYELIRAALSGRVTQGILDKVSRALEKNSSSKSFL